PPEHEHDPVSLEERGLLDVATDRPAERLVGRPGALLVREAERDQSLALLHRCDATRSSGPPRRNRPRADLPSLAVESGDDSRRPRDRGGRARVGPESRAPLEAEDR